MVTLSTYLLVIYYLDKISMVLALLIATYAISYILRSYSINRYNYYVSNGFTEDTKFHDKLGAPSGYWLIPIFISILIPSKDIMHLFLGAFLSDNLLLISPEMQETADKLVIQSRDYLDSKIINNDDAKTLFEKQ